MIKRSLVSRKCPKCLETKLVRKDAVGKNCRKCRAKINTENAIPKDITNKIFGKLKVIKIAYIKKPAHWQCECSCGNSCIVTGNRLRGGKTKSCGCILKKQKGMSTSRTYHSWQSMIQRCTDASVEHYKRYGLKGIEVCNRWKNSFQNFLEDMGERPKAKTLDRIDSKGNYEPDNCRWSTVKEQANNMSSNFIIECFNKKQTLTQWAEEYSIRVCTLRKRIVDLKWPIEKALTKKVGRYASS